MVQNVGTAPSPATMLSKRYLNGQEKGLFVCSQSFQRLTEQGTGEIKFMFL